jgi:hypothetical protein
MSYTKNADRVSGSTIVIPQITRQFIKELLATTLAHPDQGNYTLGELGYQEGDLSIRQTVLIDETLMNFLREVREVVGQLGAIYAGYLIKALASGRDLDRGLFYWWNDDQYEKVVAIMATVKIPKLGIDSPLPWRIIWR